MNSGIDKIWSNIMKSITSDHTGSIFCLKSLDALNEKFVTVDITVWWLYSQQLSSEKFTLVLNTEYVES